VTFDLRIQPDVADLALRVRAFIDSTVIPRERELESDEHGLSAELRRDLQDAARAAGVFAPTAPTSLGGHGLDHRSMGPVLEECGRSLLGPAAMNCSAPDEGNMALLELIATPDQRARYLEPLCAGEIRSSFSMTEPAPGAGSDPRLLNTEATRQGDTWVINGRKWFITGADGAAFSIVMARTDGGATMFLVDADNPGMRVERRLNTMDKAVSGGHCIVEFTDCEVRAESILGELDKGFDYAQLRLGPARLTHCMRWLGAARRVHEVAVAYASERRIFDDRLAELGMAQQMIADNEIDIAASRQLIWNAAGALDAGLPARTETSVCKTFVAEAVFRIADRSMQLCGGSGTLTDHPIARIHIESRAFRIYDGPSEVHRMSIAKRAVRRSSRGDLPGDWQ
jgi:acyl-CoA dehydrogenase